ADAELARLRKDLEDERVARQADRAAVDRLASQVAAEPPAARTLRLGVRLTGFAQLDYQVRDSSQDQLNGTTADPLNEDRFLVRRARARVDLDYGLVAGGVEFDGNTVRGSTARIVGAEASLRWPGGSG